MKKLISIVAALAAFGISTAFAADMDAKTAQQPAAAGMAKGPSDAQIAAIVVSANQVDIDAGKLAEKHTKNADVKAFAKQMVTDHSAVNKQASDLVKKLKVKPEANDTSKALEQGGKENETALKKLKGADFDKAYVDHEVAYHEQVLAAIDNTLIPNAQNAELKDLITKVRPAIAAHLEHAKTLQSKLGAGEGKSGEAK
jgi:putative membrane protein